MLFGCFASIHLANQNVHRMPNGKHSCLSSKRRCCCENVCLKDMSQCAALFSREKETRPRARQIVVLKVEGGKGVCTGAALGTWPCVQCVSQAVSFPEVCPIPLRPRQHRRLARLAGRCHSIFAAQFASERHKHLASLLSLTMPEKGIPISSAVRAYEPGLCKLPGSQSVSKACMT